ncbi:MAG TPA: sensor histidine kinase, partial [Phenylobacterium sp.]
MASIGKTTSPQPARGLDRQTAEPAQGVAGVADLASDGWNAAAGRSGRLRVRTLVALRWMMIVGELLFFLSAYFFGLTAPFAFCFAVVGLGAWVNLLTGVASPGQRLIGGQEAVAQLGFDIGRIGLLLYLTGGAANPFLVMLLAPVTLGAATLNPRAVTSLAGFAIVVIVIVAAFHRPLPTVNGVTLEPPFIYMVACAIANVVAVVIIAGTVRQAAAESARMALALDVTQAVLAREQR